MKIRARVPRSSVVMSCAALSMLTGAVLAGASGLVGAAVVADAPPDHVPAESWSTCAPEEVGMDPQGVAKALEYAAVPPTQGVVITRYGCIVGERYVGDFGPESRHESFSVAKSFSNALIGIAIEQGLIDGVDARVCQYVEAWDCEDQADSRSRVTLRHLLTLTAGLAWNEDWSSGDFSQNDAFKMSFSEDHVDFVLSRPGESEPGTSFTYSTGYPAILSGVLEKVSGKTAYDYALENLFQPIGAPGILWKSDRAGHTTTYAGVQATTREFTRLGLLYMRKGRWQDRQVVPEEWVEASTRTDTTVEGWSGYGYLWHVDLADRFDAEAIPADAFMAAGIYGQHIFVIPSEDLVITRVAKPTPAGVSGGQGWKPGEFLKLVLESIAP